MTKHRVICGLREARKCQRPNCLPRMRRPKGVKGLGLSYEQSLARALGPSAIPGQWFEFTDANGHGYCQTDILLPIGDYIVIIECKLSDKAAGYTQLSQLYFPVVALATGKQPLGIVATKYLNSNSDTSLVRGTLKDAVALAASGQTATLHWLGRGRP